MRWRTVEWKCCAFAKSARSIGDARQTWAQTDKKLQGAYANEKAYLKEMRVLDEALAKAATLSVTSLPQMPNWHATKQP